MMHRLATCAVITAISLCLAQNAHSAPYASAVRNTSGTTYEFVLNEAADNVTITRDGGNEVDLGALGAGRHTFDLGGFSNFDIAVSRSAATGYVAIDDTTEDVNAFWTSFERPGGMAINTIPSSPYFGTIYVNQNRALNGGNPVSTAAGRLMGNGIYSLSADRVGVNLTDFTVPASANDATLAKATGFTIDETSSSSLYRIGMDDGGNLIGVDWSDALGGMKVMSADLTTGAVLLRTEQGPTGGVPSDDSDEFGPLPLHGSINGEPQISGTWGVDLSVAAMDEDLDSQLRVTSAANGNNVWRWNIGSTTSDFAGAPSLEVAVGDLYTSTGLDRNSSGVTSALSGDAVGTHSDGSQVFLDCNLGCTANAQYNAHFDKWYLSGARSNGDDSSSLVILTPDGDGNDIEVDWASKQFTIDNDLDGFTDDPEVPLSLDPNNDIFRQAHNVTFSPDNATMFVHRRVVAGGNDVLGANGLEAKILAIPLDENGLPIIGVDDNGTPGDTSDDFITGVTPIFTSDTSQGSFSQVKTDAAGNLYYSSNISERMEYFSLGGISVATTSNNAALSMGEFMIEFTEPVPGDYNGNGVVDAADYTVYRDTLGDTVGVGTGADGNENGVVDPGDYDFWASRFGNTAGDPSVAVPEPSAAMLGLIALGLGGFRRR